MTEWRITDLVFFCNVAAATEIYSFWHTFSLHDALSIWFVRSNDRVLSGFLGGARCRPEGSRRARPHRRASPPVSKDRQARSSRRRRESLQARRLQSHSPPRPHDSPPASRRPDRGSA